MACLQCAADQVERVRQLLHNLSHALGALAHDIEQRKHGSPAAISAANIQ